MPPPKLDIPATPRMTGNIEKLVGVGQMLLVIFLFALPDANADEKGTAAWSLPDLSTTFDRRGQSRY